MQRFYSRVRQETPEENRRAHWPKRGEYYNKSEDNGPNTLNDENYQASFKKFRQIKSDLDFLVL